MPDQLPPDGVPHPTDSGETTGRYIVIFDDTAEPSPDDARRMLHDAAGIKSFAFADETPTSALSHPSDNEALYFPRLGVAVVAGDADMMQSLSMRASAKGPGVIIEPEYKAYALEQDFGTYMSGYRDAVNHLYGRFVDDRASGRDAAAPSAGYEDTSSATWGLIATGVTSSRWSGAGVKVAVLDTGMDLRHPDFQARAIVHASFIQGHPVQDGNGHGTHCVGTACGPRLPSTGARRYGVAHGATIHVGKVLTDQGSGVTGDIIAGMEWAMAGGCQVISMSLGANVDRKLQQYEVPIRRALAAGALVVAAAGNNARRSTGSFGFVSPPANADAAMAVGALDQRLQVAEFSARSSALTGVGGKVNLVAPGTGVFSSVPGSFGNHGVKNGTSMATPHVAGIAALVCEATGARGASLWARLEQLARPLSLSALDVGAGLVQAPQ